MLNLRILLTVVIASMSFSAFGCAGLVGSSSDNKNARPAQLPQVTAADEMVAKVKLLAIAEAEERYQVEADGEYATMDQLVQKGMFNDPSKGQLARYKFDIHVRPHGFDATAVPENYGVTGDRSFFIDETKTIRAADKHGEKATVQDPSL
jgi:hypothetical protein